MTTGPRRARLSALAKINLDLRVLHKRPDGFHEIRTVYQTISLADKIDVEFSSARRTAFHLTGDLDIPDNLIIRAATMAMDAMRVTGRVAFHLKKSIPMGAGLGGGSSDAAAVLLALPVLAGRRIAPATLIRIAGELGSDVPFFLLGGTAAGVGRGLEVYPLPDHGAARGIVIAPAIHVSTGQAYDSLGRELTTIAPGNIISSFQSSVWRTEFGVPAGGWPGCSENDFEQVVFGQYPRLKSLKTKLLRLGADHAMMTGSGSALYGIFRARERLDRALSSFQKEKVFQIRLVSRARYQSLWWRCLRHHVETKVWPPQSRYEH